MNKSVPFKEGKIRYTDTGKGRAVVFLHGFLESHEMWIYYTHHLPKTIRSICIDLPGHGKSDNFGYVHSMELMAEAVRCVLKQESIRKVIIVGHSMGGYTALAFAELYPDIVKGLIMYFSSASSDSLEKKQNRNRAIRLVEQNKSSFIRNSIPLLFAEKNRIKYRKTISSLIKKADQMGIQSIIASLGGMRDRSDREIVLKFAPFPVTYIIGELDPVLKADHLLSQSKISAINSHTFLKETGHMGFIENKKESYLAVKDFIQLIY
ncbi:MAG: pimeloyl-ACP methyl ester carboxylesterase [Halieaceae bacterium]